MNTTKKLGVWGYGVFGKSALSYFAKQGYELAVVDQRPFTEQEQQYFTTHNIRWYTQQQLDAFLHDNPQIIASPGIDTQPYLASNNQWLQELDVFYREFQKPIVAITGSIGKTTITHLLSKLLASAGKRIVTGGNIGTPMFDLLAPVYAPTELRPAQQKSDVEMAVLEVSSFQLEHCTQFAPHLAIITNLFPNHLDRHKTMEQYSAAKQNIFNHQTGSAIALLPLALQESMRTHKNTYFFSAHRPADHDLQNHTVYFIDNQTIFKAHNGSITQLIECTTLPACTFIENWLIICASLDILQIPLSIIAKTELDVPEHRLEKVAIINGIDFFNDSKSTTIQSTLAAVKALQAKPIYLLLGGLSKGVDRSTLIAQLHGLVTKIICFGKEAEQLHAWCKEQNITSSAYNTLEGAFEATIPELHAGDQLLLSPAGSSFDLYKDYKERGTHFKQLVNALKD